ncbi:Ras guanine nucleotide exchange factor J [Oopsacas minuta]|uniref:Ras guanine nucleotide exchange factor J n=1 Tax=Oopsacas minuta TaxID=111878 RepID=A0AAV7KJ38_9METZ|nr:Ras guanine nucleotide exchange factor J [Oopsacas minuta]
MDSVFLNQNEVTEISNVLQQCADELNNSPTVEKNPLYTSSEQSPRDKKPSSLIVHEESPINRMAVDNAPTKAKKHSKTPQYLSTEEIESNSSSIASASILPSAEESSDNNSTSFDELVALATGVTPTTLSFMHNSEGTYATPILHQVSSRTSQNGISRKKPRVQSGNGSLDPSPSGMKRISNKLSPRRKARCLSPKISVGRIRKYRNKEVDLTTERDIIDWLSQTRTFDPSEQQTAAKNEIEVFGGVGLGRQVFCNCPPDPEFSSNLKLNHICLEDLLQSPRELARQITLLDFDLLSRITPEDCLNYVIPEQKRGPREGFNEKDAMKLFVDKGNLGKLAFRFGQLSSWVASSVLLFDVLEDRTEALRLFIKTAMECYQLKNYHAVQAIVIGALQSPPIKHLEKTWERIPAPYKDFIDEISELFEAKNNYTKYRQCIQTTEVPAVPFFLLYMKDLTYIVNANPDYLKSGLINFDKRRLIYARLEEIQYFQSHKYQLKRVPEIRRYLFNARFIAQEKLVHVAHELESRDGRSAGSQGSLYSEGSSSREVASFYGTISRNITRRGFFNIKKSNK